jgi:hypothetical protein
MSDNDFKDRSESGSRTGHLEAAETKRLAARRRFLKKGALGSGVAVVTLYHTRGQAGSTMFVSSKAACDSLHGTLGQTKTIMSDYKTVIRQECFK